MIKSWLRKIIPGFVLRWYHLLLAGLAVFVYRFPTRRLIVIGITGTKGKSTTAYVLAKMLEAMGERVGLSGTILFKVAEKEWMNDLKMTMPGRFKLQRLFRQMVRAKCKYAVIEMTSEGVLQHRQRGVDVDVMVFTNLSPEHVERHGGFANYKAAKLALFERVAGTYRKPGVAKSFVVNIDDEHAGDFMAKRADHIYTVSTRRASADVYGTDIRSAITGSDWRVHGKPFHIGMLGEVNVLNMLMVLGVGRALGFSLEKMERALTKVPAVPGRMERIDEGQNFMVIVDYAYEPRSVEFLYQALHRLKHRSTSRIITVTGSAGGGRDVSRRPVLGRLAAQYCDIVFVTNEDPYDEDPQSIIDQVAAGAVAEGKVPGRDVFVERVRREAIRQALAMARKYDIVVLTAKGSEVTMGGPGGTYIPWNEREVARELLRKLLRSRRKAE
ncbi:MAG: hypothetical protein A3F54_00095 [Candidatus Kerfeldbacteria bacterium RIFCSPHIGHO2_12_FULL_48_17]|uniref:UDP-N-acetylmuramyl-tripeptide synthetase n=1 Tax=Candidatus Kerfeldbacteria bacterium RIFCSPHIGHO2_12_FULL_48_17 TaxID=1798542 RepID=A0A1G2B7U1_9BACT|nr:MAG: hypothetical protein A3F54_00095 [Candidatus Kerfeldbacteria bacterium RIFCSPHIGHO2_12_FULL_48_17]